jgi:hypothetical protein
MDWSPVYLASLIVAQSICENGLEASRDRIDLYQKIIDNISKRTEEKMIRAMTLARQKTERIANANQSTNPQTIDKIK